ncbi:alpha-1,3-mannosyl-glycoprotein 4-beta-N-acetylglucosaminyltransferase A-like isoform X2 [Bacillus rossius redtenbacheri]|uniref:alpha-1,3-mannosyl-glycoprotein 4-beta-N-acetylglucosaminyltransferase A-like isoform X2 n=1 Tax=Bacillus rossius redtenbacheri TaxID=93214 RepID=UPI002FDDB5B2
MGAAPRGPGCLLRRPAHACVQARRARCISCCSSRQPALHLHVSRPMSYGHEERGLAQRLAVLQAILERTEQLHRARQEDVRLLARQLGQLLGADAQPPGNVSDGDGWLLRTPTIYQFLPHLADDPLSLRPAFTLSKGRSGVSVVMGIPTVKREHQSYLTTSLHSLLNSMSAEEAADTLIIVFVAEVKQDYVSDVVKQIEHQFRDQVESGLIEVISPPASYYPDLDSLQQTLGDPLERVRWRTKQNLDFAFLMMYAQPKGTFYVQLEDDILAKKNFISTMKSYALQKIADKSPWFVLEFSQLGFIGKMFKCVQLPWLIQFFLMFYNDKPVDWLLDHLIQSKVCRFDKDAKFCKEAKAKLWVAYNSSLFQHVGLHSSLKGKVQRLQDKRFGKLTLFYPHLNNPEADVTSTIPHYKQYALVEAYRGETFFWGYQPTKGDHITFTFKSPQHLRRYMFGSGNTEHPSDIIHNTTVEVMPDLSQNNMNLNKYTITSDGFCIIGEFDSSGTATGPVDSELNPVKVIRLNVHSNSTNWVIINECVCFVADLLRSYCEK